MDHDFGWTALVNYSKKPNPLNPISPDMMYIVDVAVELSKETAHNVKNLAHVRPPEKGQEGEIQVIPFTFECIRAVSKVRLKLPMELKSFNARRSLLKTFKVCFA